MVKICKVLLKAKIKIEQVLERVTMPWSLRNGSTTRFKILTGEQQQEIYPHQFLMLLTVEQLANPKMSSSEPLRRREPVLSYRME